MRQPLSQTSFVAAWWLLGGYLVVALMIRPHCGLPRLQIQEATMSLAFVSLPYACRVPAVVCLLSCASCRVPNGRTHTRVRSFRLQT